jgi:hypothetical protein
MNVWVPVNVTEWYRIMRLMHCNNLWYTVRTYLSPNNSWSIQPVETSNIDSRESWRNMAVNFVDEISLSYSAWVFSMRNWADGFISPPNEVVILILSSLKIYCSRPGLNPLNLGPMTSTLSTRSQRPTKYVATHEVPKTSPAAKPWFLHVRNTDILRAVIKCSFLI